MAQKNFGTLPNKNILISTGILFAKGQDKNTACWENIAMLFCGKSVVKKYSPFLVGCSNFKKRWPKKKHCNIFPTGCIVNISSKNPFLILELDPGSLGIHALKVLLQKRKESNYHKLIARK